AIKDCLVEECELAQYFLTILNLSDEKKRWETLISKEDGPSVEYKAKLSDSSDSNMKRKKLFYSDHTQDFVVRDVRRTLLQTVLSFKGNLGDVNELVRLIDSQLVALRDAFRVPLESGEDGCQRVATKLLNLYRTGRLGHYTLDTVPRNCL
ncbi:Dar gtpase 2 protein, partial [Thalictrum thalictroides]